LASSSEEDDEEEVEEMNDHDDARSIRSTRSIKDPEAIDRYRALILGFGDDGKGNDESGSGSEGDTDIEEDWEPNTKTKTASALEKKQETAKLDKMLPFERLLDKQASKRKARKAAKKHEDSPDFESAMADEGKEIYRLILITASQCVCVPLVHLHARVSDCL
jgi:hypothetical protein